MLELHGKQFAPTWTRLAHVRVTWRPAGANLDPPGTGDMGPRRHLMGVTWHAPPTTSASLHPRPPGPVLPATPPLPLPPPPRPRPLPLQTATAGSSTLVLQQRVSWEVGQQIVVTTTTWRDEQVRWGLLALGAMRGGMPQRTHCLALATQLPMALLC